MSEAPNIYTQSIRTIKYFQAQRWQTVFSMFANVTSKGTITVSLQAYNAVINAAAKV
jgi:hypothetical protein